MSGAFGRGGSLKLASGMNELFLDKICEHQVCFKFEEQQRSGCHDSTWNSNWKHFHLHEFCFFRSLDHKQLQKLIAESAVCYQEVLFSCLQAPIRSVHHPLFSQVHKSI